MTLTYEVDLDILRMYVHTKTKVSRTWLSKVRERTGQTHTHTHTHTDRQVVSDHHRSCQPVSHAMSCLSHVVSVRLRWWTLPGLFVLTRYSAVAHKAARQTAVHLVPSQLGRCQRSRPTVATSARYIFPLPGWRTFTVITITTSGPFCRSCCVNLLFFSLKFVTTRKCGVLA